MKANRFRTSTRRAFLGRLLPAAALVAGLSLAGTAGAADPAPYRVGVLTDLSGPVADLSGFGTITSMKMAIEDFGGKVLGRPIELLTADHMNKPDIGLGIARKWYDEGTNAIFDIGISSVALAVQTLTRERNKAVIFISSASSDLTGKNCSPNGIHWSHNSYSQAVGVVKELQKNGGKSWYFITIDYAFGVASERDTTAMVEAGGGRRIGATRHAWDAVDFGAQLLQAQASGAEVIGLATTTGHAGAILKQAEEFGITSRQIMAPLSWGFHDVKALGLATAKGLVSSAPFYWDENEQTRAFAKRYFDRFGKMPNEVQASAYGAMKHYLQAVAAGNGDDGAAVVAQMKKTPINDFMTKDGVIRADGRVMRDLLILQVKSPQESKGEWDIYKVVGRVPANEGFQPADPAQCALVK